MSGYVNEKSLDSWLTTRASYRKDIEKLYETEQLLREAATELQKIDEEMRRVVTYNTQEKLRTAVRNLVNLHASHPVTGYELLKKSAENIASIHESAKDCVSSGIGIRNCLPLQTDIDVFNELRSFVAETTGQRCGFFDWTRDKGSVALLLNDFSNCIHVLADFAMRNLVGNKVGQKCYVADEANEKAVALCKGWDSFSERANKKRKYEDQDYKELVGYVIRDRAIFRIGSAIGHALHVDFENDKLEYYDSDEFVKQRFNTIVEDLGLYCDINDEGVFCSGVNQLSNLKELAGSIAWVTSADVRIHERCTKYCSENDVEMKELCEETMDLEGLDKIEAERAINDCVEDMCEDCCAVYLRVKKDEEMSECVDRYPDTFSEKDWEEFKKSVRLE